MKGGSKVKNNTKSQIIEIIRNEEKVLWALYKQSSIFNRGELSKKYRYQHEAILNLMDILEIERDN